MTKKCCICTDEEAWVKLAGGAIADQEAAAERARDHIADALDEHIARVDAARAGLAESIRGRDDAIRAVIAGGASAYRVAQVTGLSQGLVARIRHGVTADAATVGLPETALKQPQLVHLLSGLHERERTEGDPT